MFVLSLLAQIAQVFTSAPEVAGSGGAPAPGVTITRSDLDRHIEETVQAHYAKSLSSFDASLDSLRKEILGESRTEEIAHSRDKARADFGQVSSSERGSLLRQARNVVVGGGQQSRSKIIEERLPTTLRGIGFGHGEIAARYFSYFGHAVRHLRLGESDAHARVYDLAKAERDNVMMSILEEHRAITAGDAGSAGALVPEIIAADFIAALHATSIVRRAGALTVQMGSGNLTIGRQNATAISYWLGETEAIEPSEPTFGQLKLTAKSLGSIVLVSNDALRYTGGQMSSLIQQDMMSVHGTTEDTALIRSEGNENRPRGIRHWLHSDNIFAAASGGASVFADTTTDLIKAQFKVENGNVPILRPAWMTSVREKWGLINTKTGDASGFAFMPEIVMNGTLMGSPLYATTNIPTNLSSNKSELYYQEMTQVVIGEGMSMELTESKEATISVNGSPVNLFQQGMTAFRLEGKIDQVVRHDRSGAVVTTTVYGSSLV